MFDGVSCSNNHWSCFHRHVSRQDHHVLPGFCDKTNILAPFYIIQKHHFSPFFPGSTGSTPFLRLQRTSTGRPQVKLDANTSVDYPGSFAAYCRAWDHGRNNVSCKEGQEPGKAPGKVKSGENLGMSEMTITGWWFQT